MDKKIFPALIAFFMGSLAFPPCPPATTSSSLSKDIVIARIGTKIYTLEVADTISEKSRGLSFREKMERERGMLFIFERPGKPKFCMDGMKFALDFIWIRGNTVVGLTENVQVNISRLNCEEKSDKVIELNAGEIESSQIRIGSRIDLD